MKVFISSLIAGMEPVRVAAREAVTMLRHVPVMAEDFGAQARSPQLACLAGLRESDVVILVLGERYGAEQSSGLSATHEEYRDAKGRKPVLAFVQQGMTPEPRQEAFIREVQGWEGGLFRGTFIAVADLREEIVRGLHDYQLANAVAPLNEAQLRVRASELLAIDDRRSGSPMLNLAIVGGPNQQILRPSEIEDERLKEFIHQSALFGATRIFDPSRGVEAEIHDTALVLKQERTGQQVQLHEDGALLVRTSVEQSSRDRSGHFGLPVVIEEDVRGGLTASLAMGNAVLGRIDSTERLSHVAVGVSISGGEHLAWRTQTEHAKSPNSVSMGLGEQDRPAVVLLKPRASLRLDTLRIVDDLVVRLRRQWKGRAP